MGTRRRLRLLGCALLLVLAVSGCGDTAGPEVGLEVEDVTRDEFFDATGYLGTRITVSSTVIGVLSPESFLLAGEDDEVTLLVLTNKPIADRLEPGDVVQVSGTLGVFGYPRYAQQYQLAEPESYAEFAGEKFLYRAVIDPTVPDFE